MDDTGTIPSWLQQGEIRMFKALVMTIATSASIAISSPASAQILPPVGGDDRGTLECMPGNARGNLDCSFSPGVAVSSQDDEQPEDSTADPYEFCRSLPMLRQQVEADRLMNGQLRVELNLIIDRAHPNDAERIRTMERLLADMEANVAGRSENLTLAEPVCRDLERAPPQRNDDGVPA